MRSGEFSAQLKALRDIITPLANIGSIEEYLIGTFQAWQIDLIANAENAGFDKAEALAEAADNLRLLVEIAHRDHLTLSNEFVALLGEAQDH